MIRRFSQINTHSVLSITVLLFLSFLLHSCRITPAKITPENESGEVLAQQYCGSCHHPPAPELLDKSSWKDGVLPNMARRLGIAVYGFNQYAYIPGDTGAVSFEKWMKIVDYYLQAAPDSLPIAVRPQPISRDWSLFSLKKPAEPSSVFAQTTLTALDTATGLLYTSNGLSSYLYEWNKELQITDSVLLPSPAAYANFYNDARGSRQAVFTCLGTMVADDVIAGKLMRFDISKNLQTQPFTLASNLPRPVQSVRSDLNNDGLEDWIVCGFGHNTGALYWYQQEKNGNLTQHTILNIPGATVAIPGDFNNDGWNDILVLFAHGDESIRLFLNDKKGGFTNRKILSFPPVYGSSSMQLVDFNKDGLPDILYTAGDNSDYSKILKPYHGVYIFLNKGNFKFEQSWFYPVNGSTKAVAEDFDQDGDLDIAAIAMYADFKNHPEEKFIYFEQDKPLHFLPHSPPIDKNGRWITLEAQDYDHDGDKDIILGNFPTGFINQQTFTPDWDKHTPLIILENKKIH